MPSPAKSGSDLEVGPAGKNGFADAVAGGHRAAHGGLHDDPGAVRRVRWTLVRRGVLLYLFGYVFNWVWPGTILFYYGAFFVVGAVLFALRDRWVLAIGAAAAVTLFPGSRSVIVSWVVASITPTRRRSSVLSGMVKLIQHLRPERLGQLGSEIAGTETVPHETAAVAEAIGIPVVVGRGEALRGGGATVVHHHGIGVGTAEPVVLLQEGHLRLVLGVAQLGELFEEERNRLAVLLLDGGKLRRPVTTG